MAVLKFVLLAAFCASAIATVVDIKPCDEYASDICTVSQTRITPCTNEKRCLLKKYTNISMAFDFTPNFSTAKAKTMVFGLIGNEYREFAGFGSNDACKYANCPIEAGKLQTLNYNMYLEKYIPKGTYDLKWKLWNEENDQQGCCFKMGIKIRK